MPRGAWAQVQECFRQVVTSSLCSKSIYFQSRLVIKLAFWKQMKTFSWCYNNHFHWFWLLCLAENNLPNPNQSRCGHNLFSIGTFIAFISFWQILICEVYETQYFFWNVFLPIEGRQPLLVLSVDVIHMALCNVTQHLDTTVPHMLGFPLNYSDLIWCFPWWKLYFSVFSCDVITGVTASSLRWRHHVDTRCPCDKALIRIGFRLWARR